MHYRQYLVICNSVKKIEHSKIGISKRNNYFCDQINKEKSTNIYEKLKSASDNRDSDSYLDLLHDEFVFARHQTGTEVSKADWEPTIHAMMESTSLEIMNDRCLSENDDILVMHQMMNFPDGTIEAVMIVNTKKDGKIVRTETGATPLKQD